MVKPEPKTRTNLSRRRKKFMELKHPKLRETLLLNHNLRTKKTNTQDSVSVTNDDHQHLLLLPPILQQQKTTIAEDDDGSNLGAKSQNESPVTPVQQPLSKKRRSRSPTTHTSSTYATCSSSSPPLSPSSASSPFKNSPYFLNPNSISPQFCRSQQFLRRTVSDPPVFLSDSSAERSSSSEKIRKIKQELSESPEKCPDSMGQFQLPPLPPAPSPKLLRRTVSDPVPLLPNPKEKNEKNGVKEQIVKTEKLSEQWTIFKVKCECGAENKFLYCVADNKCYKLV